MSLAYPPRHEGDEVLNTDQATHLGVSPDGHRRTLRVRELEARSPVLVGPAQLWGLVGGGIAGAILVALLAYLIERGTWIPAGFTPFVTASTDAVVVGGALAGLGIGGLLGAVAGMVIDARRRYPLGRARTFYVPADEGPGQQVGYAAFERWERRVVITGPTTGEGPTPESGGEG